MGIIAAMKAPILSCAIILTLVFSAVNAVYANSARWKLNPTSGDWNTAANWTPDTVPNGQTDIATFHVSNVTNVSTSLTTDVDSVVFTTDANAYMLTVDGDSAFFNFWGAGVVNNSANEQNIVVLPMATAMVFHNEATAGDRVNYQAVDADITFSDSASAGSASFVIEPTFQSFMFFADNSTAATSTIFVDQGAYLVFLEDATAGSATVTNNEGGSTSLGVGGADNATFINNGGTASGSFGGVTYVPIGSAANSTFIVHAGTVDGAEGGWVGVDGDAANATFLIDGSAVSGASGGTAVFRFQGTADNAIIIANGGVDGGGGGLIQFTGSSMGATSRVEVFGNATLDISEHDLPSVRVGSLEGDGLVFLGPVKLVVGSNGLSTTFSGVVQDTGELTKLGNGTLTLSGANSYTGGTTVSDGILLVSNRSGSGTGTGAVQVDAGTLGGRGLISGAVTVGTGTGAGAFLSTSEEALKQLTLTIQSALTFKADGTYTYRLNTRKPKADKVIADGVTIEAGATFAFVGMGNRALTPGTVFTAISNTSANPISGSFSNLADGSVFTANGNNFQASYEGGDGNDLALTVVP